MHFLNLIILTMFAICGAGLLIPESNIATTIWKVGFCGLLISVGIWVIKSTKNREYLCIGRCETVCEGDWHLPWKEILGKMAKLRLHYMYLINIVLCGYASHRGAESWHVGMAAIFSAAFLFLIGQALVMGRSFTNHGTLDKQGTPRKFRRNFILLVILYIFSCVVPFVPIGRLGQ